jgi:6-phosphogluconolactonase (cycloisomerase 2 family)
VGHDGRLRAIPDSIAFLTAANSGAASLSFSPDGQFLLVTEKITNNTDAFHIQIDGILGPLLVNLSVGPGAFAVRFAPNGEALVSETRPAGGHNAAAISSYAVQANGTLSPISASVPTLSAGTCWQEVTLGGRFVYTSNSASSTISGRSLAANGALTPLPGTVVATLPSGSTNLDIAISADGKFHQAVEVQLAEWTASNVFGEGACKGPVMEGVGNAVGAGAWFWAVAFSTSGLCAAWG